MAAQRYKYYGKNCRCERNLCAGCGPMGDPPCEHGTPGCSEPVGDYDKTLECDHPLHAKRHTLRISSGLERRERNYFYAAPA